MKKTMILLATLILLTGCGSGEKTDYEQPDIDNKTEHTHKINVENNEYTVTTKYDTESKKGWNVLEHRQGIKSGISSNQIEGYTLTVNSVQAEVKTIGKLKKGSKPEMEDLINLDYIENYSDYTANGAFVGSNLPLETIMPSKTEDVYNPFWQKPRNYPGSEINEYKYQQRSESSNLKVTWTLSITDNETKNTYITKISDDVKLNLSVVKKPPMKVSDYIFITMLLLLGVVTIILGLMAIVSQFIAENPEEE